MPKIRMVCAECGSEDVLKDAFAEWCVETQKWELHSAYDECVCQSDVCNGASVSIEIEEIEVE